MVFRLADRQRLNLRRKCEALRTIYRHCEIGENRWQNLGMRCSIALFSGVAVFGFVFNFTSHASANETVIDLRKYQHIDGTIRHKPQTFFSGYTPKVAPQPKSNNSATDFIVVQPKQANLQIQIRARLI